MGYGDGLSRALSNKGHVLVRGRRAPIVGIVSMDLTSVDVTDIPGAELGDEVVVLGSQRGPLGEDLLPANWPWLAPLAGPLALLAAAAGARATWSHSRPLAWFAAALVARIPGAVGLELAGLRHTAPITDPAPIAAALRAALALPPAAAPVAPPPLPLPQPQESPA